MFNTKLPHMLCSKCETKVARDAYYCKSCGEVIDDATAPGKKVEDRRLSSKLNFALQRHLIRNLTLGIFLIFFLATGVNLGIKYLHAVRDNGSSAIYKLTVVAPDDPMTCRGAICHILIDVTNKTALIQKLEVIPDLVTRDGVRFSPADPARMGNGSHYCEQKISLTMQPHQRARYIGLCAQDIPVGRELGLAELRDSSGALVVSGVFKAYAS